MKYYIYLDGDDIGDRINEYLKQGELRLAQNFSNNINKAMDEIREICRKIDGCTLKICGGDDLLIEFIDTSVENICKSVRIIQNHFKSKTGNTLSGGGGTSLSKMLDNLSISKTQKNNTFVMEEK